MSTSRNAPCPCGSGRKFKRCCAARSHDRVAEEARRDERVGREAEDWAFAQFGDELVASGAALHAQLAGSGHATWIATQWVMLDHELRDGGTAAGRYAELGHLPAADRERAARIASSRVGVHRVLSCRPGDGMHLEDVLGGDVRAFASPRVSREAAVGDLLVARVMDGPAPSLWGPARAFRSEHRSALLDELARLGGEADLRRSWPLLLTFAPAAVPPVIARLAERESRPIALHETRPAHRRRAA